MADLPINTRWHPNSNYTYRAVYGTLTAYLDGSTVKARVQLTQNSTYTAYGNPYANDTVTLYIGDSAVASGSLKTYTNVSGSTTFDSGEKSKSFTTGGDVTVYVTMTCHDDSGNCTVGGPSHPQTVGSITLTVPDPYTPPSYAIVKMNDNIGRVDTSNGYRIEYYIRRWYKYYIRL